MTLLYITLGLILGVPLITLLYGTVTGVIDKFYYAYVTWGFRFGMRLARQDEAGELSAIQRALAYVFVVYIFLPSDLGLSSIVSRQIGLMPRFKLTTTLVSEIIGSRLKTLDDKRRKEIAVALRKFADDNKVTNDQIIQAATGLKIFDIIDNRDGDTEHFRRANDYRSKYDPDLV